MDISELPPLPEHMREIADVRLALPPRQMRRLTEKGEGPPWVWARSLSASHLPVVGEFAAVDVIGNAAWLVRGYLRASTSGAPTIWRLSIEPYQDGSLDITAKLQRSIRTGEIHAKALAWLRDEKRVAVGAQLLRDRMRGASPVPPNPESPRRAGRPSYDTDHYRRVAHTFHHVVVELGVERGAYEQVGRRLRSEANPVPTGTVRDWISKARRMQILGPTTRGRLSAERGPNFYQPDHERHTSRGGEHG